MVVLLVVRCQRVDQNVGVCQGAGAVEKAVKRVDAKKPLPPKRLVLVLQTSEETLDKSALDAELAPRFILDNKEHRDRRLPAAVPLVTEER